MAFFNSKNVDVAFKKYQIKYFIIILLATLAINMPPMHSVCQIDFKKLQTKLFKLFYQTALKFSSIYIVPSLMRNFLFSFPNIRKEL